MENNILNKFATVIGRIMEIVHWVAAGLLGASLIVYFVNESWLKHFLDLGGEFSVGGYALNVFDESGALIPTAFVTAMVAGFLSCVLTAMIFRNIYLIFKTSAGKTKFSKGATPFQEDNVRMVREIGIFAIAIPVVESICDVIAKVVVAEADVLESSISGAGVVLGIAMLCLSQFFAYGVRLQSDSDGLL